MIESFKTHPFHDEDVDLDNPEVLFKIIENRADGMVYYGLILASIRKSEKSGIGKDDDTFYGRFTLKKRPYLGPTSLEHELSFLMAN